RRYISKSPETPDREKVESLIHDMEQLEAAQPSAPEPARPAAPTPAPARLASPRPPPSAPAAATQFPGAAPEDPALSQEPGKPIYQRWWLWAGIGAVAAGSAAAIIYANQPHALQPTYGVVNAR